MTRLQSPALVAFLLLSAGGWQAVFADDVQVNTYTTRSQRAPSVAMNAEGAFVVVWQGEGSAGTDRSSASVHGQRFASDGFPAGGEFQVNTYTTNLQLSPRVAIDAEGDFVVVWYSSGSSGTDSSNLSIQGQRYASDGSSLGGEFQVNSYTTAQQWLPSVAMDADGDFVVVWRSYGSYGTDPNLTIQGQRYASDGSTVGGEFQVNTYTTDRQTAPSVAMTPEGDFVVVWSSTGSSGTDTSSYSVQAQRFASDGSLAGGQFQVNTYTTAGQGSPAVAMSPEGDFVVVWIDFDWNADPDPYFAIQGRRYAAHGAAEGDQFQINTYTPGYKFDSRVAMDADGDFVVVWSSEGYHGTDSSEFSIQARRYASDGSSWGGQFQVNTYTSSYQLSPSISVDGAGNFVVAWYSYGSSGTDTHYESIQKLDGTLHVGEAVIFSDGFESGDTSSWSGAVH